MIYPACIVLSRQNCRLIRISHKTIQDCVRLSYKPPQFSINLPLLLVTPSQLWSARSQPMTREIPTKKTEWDLYLLMLDGHSPLRMSSNRCNRSVRCSMLSTRTPVQPDMSSDMPPDMSLDIPPDELTSIETSYSIVCKPADLMQSINGT